MLVLKSFLKTSFFCFCFFMQNLWNYSEFWIYSKNKSTYALIPFRDICLFLVHIGTYLKSTSEILLHFISFKMLQIQTFPTFFLSGDVQLVWKPVQNVNYYKLASPLNDLRFCLSFILRSWGISTYLLIYFFKMHASLRSFQSHSHWTKVTLTKWGIMGWHRPNVVSCVFSDDTMCNWTVTFIFPRFKYLTEVFLSLFLQSEATC